MSAGARSLRRATVAADIGEAVIACREPIAEIEGTHTGYAIPQRQPAAMCG